jgi:hypothetical protein
MMGVAICCDHKGVVNYAWTEKYPHGDPLLDDVKVKLCLVRGMTILLEKMNRFY